MGWNGTGMGTHCDYIENLSPSFWLDLAWLQLGLRLRFVKINTKITPQNQRKLHLRLWTSTHFLQISWDLNWSFDIEWLSTWELQWTPKYDKRFQLGDYIEQKIFFVFGLKIEGEGGGSIFPLAYKFEIIWNFVLGFPWYRVGMDCDNNDIVFKVLSDFSFFWSGSGLSL